MSEKAVIYDTVYQQADALLPAEIPYISAMGNIAALLYTGLPHINWAGFYVLHDGALQLGPFCGKPACLRIDMGKGVCGTAASAGNTYVVPDVHAFPGHIACDSASNAEIVVPMRHEGRIAAVLDIDSPLKARFDDMDRQYLERICRLLEKRVSWHAFTL